jgi:RNA 2',3'-cyclic 3'-phosphodiesterase
MMEPLRLFVALELPPPVRQALRDAQAALAAHKLAVRWVDPDGAHLTLKFLGAVPAAEVAAVAAAMREAARDHAPFALQTTSVGAFPNTRNPRVVWLGIDGALHALHTLQADVERLLVPLGYATEQRAFNPHLTLGRAHKNLTDVERAAIGRAIAQASPQHAEWIADAVSLMRSERLPDRARYTPVERHVLTPPARLV